MPELNWPAGNYLMEHCRNGVLDGMVFGGILSSQVDTLEDDENYGNLSKL